MCQADMRAMGGVLALAMLGVLSAGQTCALSGVARAPLGLGVCWRACAPRGVRWRALLCEASIERAFDSGMFTPALLEYMQASRESHDARDIIFHRGMMKMCAGLRKEDACAAASIDATRRANNALIHVIDDADGDARAQASEGRKGRERKRAQ